MYAILLYRTQKGLIHAEILDVRKQPDLAWYYDNLQCGLIEHAVRRVWNQFDFVFDEEYLLRKQPGDLPIAVCSDKNWQEQIFGRLLVLPYYEDAEDFAFFGELSKAEKAKRQLLDFMKLYSSDKKEYFLALEYGLY